MADRLQHPSHRTVAWTAAFSLALAALSGATAQAQGVPPPPAPRLPPIPQMPMVNPPAYGSTPSGRCGSQDWTCRIDLLERRVALLERELERGGDRGGRRSQSTEMTVDRDCIFDSCPSMASKLCTDAGFARGLPVEVRQNGSWQRLVRAACMD